MSAPHEPIPPRGLLQQAHVLQLRNRSELLQVRVFELRHNLTAYDAM